MSTDEPTIRTLLRELPKMRVVLVLLLVVVNMSLAVYRRGCAIGRERGSVGTAQADWSGRGFIFIEEGVTPEDEDLREGKILRFVSPARWSRNEWRETFWPWR